MTETYETLSGRSFSLEQLTFEEKRFLGEVAELYRRQPPWASFASTWPQMARDRLWRDEQSPAGHPVWEICHDLASRLGIEEGRIAPPDYRDRLAALIDEQFRSRYEFCQKTGIDEGHLSRVLAGRKHFAPATLENALRAVGVILDFTRVSDLQAHTLSRLPRQLENALQVDPNVLRLAEISHKIAFIKSFGSWAAKPASERAEPPRLAEAGLAPPDRDELSQLLSREPVSAADLAVAEKAAMEEQLVVLERLRDQATERLSGISAKVKRTASVGPAIHSPQGGGEAGKTAACHPFKACLEFGIEQVGRHYPTDCCFLFYPGSLATEPLIHQLGRSLPISPSIIGAGTSETCWAALLKTELRRSDLKQLERMASSNGAQFCADKREAQAFLCDAEASRRLFSDSDTSCIERLLSDNQIIRLRFTRYEVTRPALFEIASQLGITFVLVHACVIAHGFCDFIAFDRHDQPLKEYDARLSLLSDRRFFAEFGVEAVSRIRNLREFRKDLKADLVHLVGRADRNTQGEAASRSRRGPRVAGVAQQFPYPTAPILDCFKDGLVADSAWAGLGVVRHPPYALLRAYEEKTP